MSSITYCDFCEEEINSRIHEVSGSFSIDQKRNILISRNFHFLIKFTANFNTTNVHWCNNCLVKALKSSL